MTSLWTDSNDSGVFGAAFVSEGNSTSTPLVGDATFTGSTDEVTGFSSISVLVRSDADSAADGLTLEQSTDGTNWDRTRTLTLSAGVTQTHSISVVSRYFRLVLTNGSGAQGELRIQTIYHRTRARDLTGGTQVVFQGWEDVLLNRPVSDWITDVNVGRAAHMSTLTRYGRNQAIGTGSFSDIWSVGGAYPWPTAALALRAKSGGNVADTSDGAGARTVRIEGLDANFNEIAETITLAGASASAATTALFSRVNRAYVVTSGTYSGANTGAINIETTGGTTLARLAAGIGRAQLGLYTVPATKTAYLTRTFLSANANPNKTATVRMYRRENADTVAAPFAPRELVDAFDKISGALSVDRKAYISFPPKTDIWFAAIGDTGTTEVSVFFDMLLVDV